LNLDATLEQFEERFDSGDIFRSETEICSLHLVPVPRDSGTLSAGDMPPYFEIQNNGFTGDNYRERPYARILPKFTTKSNTFTVHYRVQVLKQANRRTTGGAWGTWNEDSDFVLAEQRGSYTIERYIDPNDPELLGPPVVDPATEPVLADASMEKYYKFRVVEHKKFSP
ncbi:MAG: Verru/Chthon cassette protein A, partial [Chthoniobacterales bacterium]